MYVCPLLCLPPARSVGAKTLSERNRLLGVSKYLHNKRGKYSFIFPDAKWVRLQLQQAVTAWSSDSASLAQVFPKGELLASVMHYL